MKSNAPRSLRGTLVGGLALLLPLVFLAWLLQKVWDVVTKLAGPATAFVPERLEGGVLVSAIATGILLLAVVYVTGLLARTSAAQRLIGRPASTSPRRSASRSIWARSPAISCARGPGRRRLTLRMARNPGADHDGSSSRNKRSKAPGASHLGVRPESAVDARRRTGEESAQVPGT